MSGNVPRVEWSIEAVADLGSAARTGVKQMDAISAAVERFARGEPTDIKKLQGNSERWRLRQGDWRVLMVRRTDGSYLVVEVKNRRDAYAD